MFIVQLSDFHLNESSNMDVINHKTDKAIDALSSRLVGEKKILICICGDVVERGSGGGYERASSVLHRIKKSFPDRDLRFEFVPGNHDLCGDSFSKFDSFAKEFTKDSLCGFLKCPVMFKDYGSFDLVLINSAFHKDNKYGCVDTKTLSDLLDTSEKPKIALIHHTLLSRYDSDSSTIRNGYKFSKLLKLGNFHALLHGHTHGYSDLVVGGNCPVIGVGPIFKSITDINSQFNLIKVFRGKVLSVENFYYRMDTEMFDSKLVLQNQHQTTFYGSSASKLQLDILEEIKEVGLICNLSFNVRSTAESFYIDIESAYPEIIPIAENWIAGKLPSNLPYNHAQFFNRGDAKGMQYIVEELRRKPTSSRAIIPLISAVDVVKSEDGFLPALNIIQFGYNDETREELYVTVYLRALEVKHFLPINLCEIYLLSKIITEVFRATKYINITFNAFRAQYKEAFGCHEKAKLDMLTQAKVMLYLMQKDVPMLRNLIQEKLKLSETVIIDSGIQNLSTCINEIVKSMGEKYYSPEIIDTIFSLQSECDQLMKLRKSTSLYTEIKKAENNLTESLRKLDGLFKEMETPS